MLSRASTAAVLASARKPPEYPRIAAFPLAAASLARSCCSRRCRSRSRCARRRDEEQPERIAFLDARRVQAPVWAHGPRRGVAHRAAARIDRHRRAVDLVGRTGRPGRAGRGRRPARRRSRRSRRRRAAPARRRGRAGGSSRRSPRWRRSPPPATVKAKSRFALPEPDAKTAFLTAPPTFR